MTTNPARLLWLEAYRGARLARVLGLQLRRRGATVQASVNVELTTLHRLGGPDFLLNYRANRALVDREDRPSLPSFEVLIRRGRPRSAARARAESADFKREDARELEAA